MIKFLIAGSVEVSLNVDDLDDVEDIQCNDAAIKSKLSQTFGMRNMIGDAANGLNLLAGIKSLGLPYTVLEGQEILDLPETPMPENYID
jgi:hypothetical protein